MRRRFIVPFTLLVLFLLSCNFLAGATSQPTASADHLDETNTRGGSESDSHFGSIFFCEGITEDGQPIRPTTSFPAGSTKVRAIFTYEGMQDGQTWGRLWERDGKVYFDGRGQIWDAGSDGWRTYSIRDSDNIPLSGHFTLTLYIGNEPAQQASFDVAPPEKQGQPEFASFGPIQFSSQITDDNIPVGIASQFSVGTTMVYAVFVYINMTPGQSWRREWLQDGEIVAERDLEWEGDRDGVDYVSLNDEDGLGSGQYTLNLYIDGQLVRSAVFGVVTESSSQTGDPAEPDEIIDADLLPAWEMLYYAVDEFSFLHNTAQFALDHHVEIPMDESYDGSTLASYRYDEDSCQPNYESGKVIVYRQTWDQSSWEELAGTLAHELTHAMQHYDGNYRCPGCSVDKEYAAFIAEIYTWWMLGRTDLIEEEIPAFDEYGYFDTDMLWDVVDELYGDSCPEY